MGSFKDVVGHNDIINYIRNAVSMDQVTHAYILNGERGAGKKLVAKLFATTLLCEEGGPDPCNRCHSCRQAEGGNHPDIIWVTHEKPNSISVDDIREQVNNTIMIKPYQGPYKVYVIDHADIMTPQAQNALLKTIEEPPQYAVIMLLTENAEMLLPTIASRCVMLKLRYIRDILIKKYLMETLKVPDYKADMCTAFAQGNMGRAIMLANSEHYNEIREEAVQTLKYIHEMELNEVIQAVNRISSYKLEISDYLDIMVVWFRDVLLYKATRDVDVVVFKEELDSIREQARKSSYEGIQLIITSFDRAKERLKANVNFELVMELLFLTIQEN
ncbi:MAG: DNA polymerase III subunit delta' [Dorea sp.]|jgi:DNA polymerase-3 subunit delta'|nr:DNA polymerase III subunit delta' [Dorea sp.]MCI9613934.1 DNA polymerase III subunit delta' [Dorea sp.]MDE6937631.1 DNA polymerase III subunit delta' [Lachnospiraceae bacterium]